jgi:hypothetical protein
LAVEVRTGNDPVEAGKQAMRSQLEHMDGSDRTVQRLGEEVPGAFQSSAAQVWRERLDDWHRAYLQIKASFDDALGGFTQAHNLIDQHHEHAVRLAGASFAGNGVYQGLQ